MNSSDALGRLLYRLTRGLKVDYPLAGALLLLMMYGLMVLYSASDQHFGTIIRQGVRLGVGIFVLLVIARIPPATLRFLSPWLYAMALLLLLMVGFFGEGVGAQRWLDLGFVRFQPSELMKLTLPMMVAAWLSQRPMPPNVPTVVVCIVIIAVPLWLIVRQPDLGTALLVGISGIFVLFLAGLRWWWIAGVLVSALAAAPMIWNLLHDYQRSRILTLLNPESDPLGRDWNIIQSKIAVGSGGWTGKGWLNGTQSHLDYLPEGSTDFIMAVLAEEFGLLGVLALLLLYAFIIGRCMLIAMQSRDEYGRLLAGAISMTFAIYILVNAGMISGILPVVGVPLPLISYGGTSIVTLMAGFGILMAVRSHRGLLHR